MQGGCPFVPTLDLSAVHPEDSIVLVQVSHIPCRKTSKNLQFSSANIFGPSLFLGHIYSVIWLIEYPFISDQFDQFPFLL